MDVRALIFDFGNVVAFFDHRRASRRLAEHAGVPEEEVHRFLFGGRLEQDYDSNRITTEEFLRLVTDGCRLRCTPEQAAGWYADIFWPNPDVAALFPRLQGRYRLLLGSNTCELHSRHFRKQFAATLAHFDDLVLSHDVGCRKPAAEFFRHCVRRAGCRPGECVFIDDLPANVEGARACGLRGIVYTGSEQLVRDLAGHGVVLAEDSRRTGA